jgi:hypothetical protein
MKHSKHRYRPLRSTPARWRSPSRVTRPVSPLNNAVQAAQPLTPTAQEQMSTVSPPIHWVPLSAHPDAHTSGLVMICVWLDSKSKPSTARTPNSVLFSSSAGTLSNVMGSPRASRVPKSRTAMTKTARPSFITVPIGVGPSKRHARTAERPIRAATGKSPGEHSHVALAPAATVVPVVREAPEGGGL